MSDLGLNLGIGLGAGSGGAPVIVPVPVSGLVAYGRFDQRITLNGSNVSSWGDLVGANNLVQATSGNQPAFMTGGVNGKSFVRMTSTGAKYLLGSFTSQLTGTGLTVLVVATVTSTAAGRIMSAYAGSAVNDFDAGSMTVDTASATQQSIVDSGAITKSVQTVSSMATGLSGVWSARFNGTNCIVRMGGVDGSTVADTTSFALNKFSFGIGWQGSAIAGQQTTQDVYEWAIYNRALAGADFTAWSAYTTTEYGLAA